MERREKIVPIRLTENEYQELLDMAKESGCQDNLSGYIRDSLFSFRKGKSDYREFVMQLGQLRSEVNHTLMLYKKDFLTDAQLELENCNKKLTELQKEVMRNGNHNSRAHKGKYKSKSCPAFKKCN